MPGMTRALRLMGLISLLLFSAAATAAVGPRSLIPRLSIIEETEITVFKDHRSKIKVKGAQKIQTEDGQVPKVRLISFDKNEMRLNSFKAWTVNGDEESEVPSNMVQTTPVSEEAGFSSYVTIEVAFPKMNVGSNIRWEYEIEETVAPVLGFFSYLYRLDSEYHTAEGFRFKVNSELPISFWENDPNGVLEITRKGNGMEARLKKSISHYIVNETYGVLSQTRFPTLFVSTAAKWADIGAGLKQKYEDRLNEPLSPLLNGILLKVKRQRGFHNQARELNRLLGNEIRYMGDWRGRHSGQVPRSIASISESQFGDCKDFALMATKILRTIGYKANFASVFSDRIPVPDFYYTHPNNYFNHQIVHVQIGKQEYWLDPTSQDEVALADDTLANRKALVWGDTPEMRRIPAYKETDNGFRYKLVMTPTNNQRFLGDLEIESWGLESKFARDENNVENPMIRWMMTFFPDIKATSQEFHTHSPRISRPWAHRARGLGTFEDVFDRTPMGDGLRLGYSGFLRALLDVNDTWISDFDFGFPSDRRYEVEFKNRQFVMSGEESCKIQSPWLNIEVSVKNRAGSGYLTYTEMFKMPEIPNAKLKSKEFRSLQGQIKGCLASRILILKSPQELRQGGVQRGLASDGPSIQLKRVGPATGMTKYYPKKLTPMKSPMPPKRVVATPQHQMATPQAHSAPAPAAKPVPAKPTPAKQTQAKPAPAKKTAAKQAVPPRKPSGKASKPQKK